MTERTAQQPDVEEPIEENPPEPQQTSGQTTVPEQLVEERAEPSTSAPNTTPTKEDTSAPRGPDQAEEQQPEVAKSRLADATARGKAIVVVETTNSRPAPPLEQEAKEDKVEEILGHPQDKRQHVYVSRRRNDEWVMHEEIPEVEETLKVERAAKRLVTEVQVCLA